MFYHILKFLAAVIGIEPMHNRFRVYRLTAWLHRKYFSIILYFFENVHKIFRKLNYNEIMAKILVVDDEKLIREMIYKYATHEGFDVVLAVDGRDAIDKFGKEDFDVCIIDIMMPDMSGYDTLKKMKEIKINSEYEVEIRANMLVVIDLIKEKLKNKVCSIDINDYIWSQGRNKNIELKPYHLTRNTNY